MIIRTAKQADEDAVYKLSQNFPSPTKISRDSFESSWRKKTNDSNSYTSVSELNNEIIGYVAGYVHRPIYANGPTFWVDELLVKENFRREGVGSMLMDSVEQRATQRKCKQILLASSKSAAFYEKLGFNGTATYLKNICNAQNKKYKYC